MQACWSFWEIFSTGSGTAEYRQIGNPVYVRELEVSVHLSGYHTTL